MTPTRLPQPRLGGSTRKGPRPSASQLRALGKVLATVASLLLLSSNATLARAGESNSTEVRVDLQALAHDWVEAHDFSGTYLVTRGGEVLAHGARGLASTATGEAVTEEHAFWIGSVSKQFAAAAVLRLVDDGRMDLQAPLASYLEGLDPSALELDGAACSVEHALSHTCGLPPVVAPVADTGGHLVAAERARALYRGVEFIGLLTEPGTTFLYSNVGYQLIGLAIQAVTGQPYEAFLQQQFWQPLGMTHTGIQPTSSAKLARGQTGALLGWVDLERVSVLDADRMGEVGAAGDVYSTSVDLARWITAIHSGEVLSDKIYRELTRPRKESYALGWIVKEKEPPLGTVLSHGGRLSPWGFTSIVAHVPSQAITLVLLSNQQMSGKARKEFANLLLRRAANAPEVELVAPPSAWRRRLGASTLLLGQTGLLSLCLWGVLRALRRTGARPRIWWMVRFHLCSFVAAGTLFLFQRSPMHPLLIAWGLMTASGAAVGCWRAATRRPIARTLGWLVFGAESLLLAALLLVSPEYLRVALLVVLAAEVLLSLGKWLVAGRRGKVSTSL